MTCKKFIVNMSEWSCLILNEPIKLENVQKVKMYVLSDNPGECPVWFWFFFFSFFSYSSATLSMQCKFQGGLSYGGFWYKKFSSSFHIFFLIRKC